MGQDRRLGVSARQGMTLVEVVLVVGLLAMAAGWAVPRFSRAYGRFLTRQKARHVALVMRYAQGRAVVKAEPMRLVVGDRSYWLERCGTGPKERGCRPMSGRMGRRFRVPDGVVLRADRKELMFYPDGTIDRGEVSLCRGRECRVVSTRLVRGYVSEF